MAACAAVLGQLPSGAHLVLGDDCYQGVAGIAEAGARDHGWRVERLPVADERWIAARGEADLLWVESPSNPLLDVADVAAICAAPRRAGTLVVVDNTFATPLRQQPLELGADIVVHSATKFIGGPLRPAARRRGRRRRRTSCARLRAARGLNGATPGTLECFLALRGARGRSRCGCARLGERGRAGRAARRAPAVARVRYPGFGAIVSFELADAAGRGPRLRARSASIRHATSLGGVERRMERRAAHPGQEHIPPG